MDRLGTRICGVTQSVTDKKIYIIVYFVLYTVSNFIVVF